MACFYHCVFAHWAWNGEDTSYSPILLLNLQSFELLAPFHPELLQASLSIALQLSAAVFMSTCYKYRSPGLPTACFPHIAPSRTFTANLLCLIACHNNEWCLLHKISWSNFSSFVFEKLHHLLSYLSIFCLTFLSSSMFQMHLTPSFHFPYVPCFWRIKSNTSSPTFISFYFFQLTLFQTE